MREELLVLVEAFGCKYSKILDRMDETGDFTEATAAEEAFADQILSRIKARLQASLLTVEEIRPLMPPLGWNDNDEAEMNVRRIAAQAQLANSLKALD